MEETANREKASRVIIWAENDDSLSAHSFYFYQEYNWFVIKLYGRYLSIIILTILNRLLCNGNRIVVLYWSIFGRVST